MSSRLALIQFLGAASRNDVRKNCSVQVLFGMDMGSRLAETLGNWSGRAGFLNRGPPAHCFLAPRDEVVAEQKLVSFDIQHVGSDGLKHGHQDARPTKCDVPMFSDQDSSFLDAQIGRLGPLACATCDPCEVTVGAASPVSFFLQPFAVRSVLFILCAVGSICFEHEWMEL